MRLVLVGPPGSGKGTQAERLVKRFNLTPIGTGAMFRDAIARGTEMGREVEPLAWFEALALWKAAVFCEAIYGRFTRGELGAEDARAAAFETAVPLMAETAAERLG